MAGTVYFQFSADTLGGAGFTTADLRSVYAVRYRDSLLSQPSDTLRQAQSTATNQSGSSFSLYKRQFFLYFPGDSTSGYAAHYKIIVPAIKRDFKVLQVSLEKQIQKPCKCEYVTDLRIKLDGKAITVPQSRPEKSVLILNK